MLWDAHGDCFTPDFGNGPLLRLGDCAFAELAGLWSTPVNPIQSIRQTCAFYSSIVIFRYQGSLKGAKLFSRRVNTLNCGTSPLLIMINKNQIIS